MVTGELPPEAEPGGTVVVNDVTGTFTGSHTWTAEIPMTTVGYVTVVRAVYTEPDGGRYVQNSALINGPKVDDGERSPDGVGMRFTNTGLDGLGGVINDLAGSSFDISGLILAQHPLIPPTDAGLGVTITGSAYEAGSSGVSIDAASTAGGVTTHIAVNDLFIGLDLQLSGLISGACKLELNIPTTTIDAAFDLTPDAADPAKVDVNLLGTPVVATEGVSYQFISGICDPSTPLLGSIIDSQAGSAIEGTVKDGFAGQLADPDGTGPADSSIADAIETALARDLDRRLDRRGHAGEPRRAVHAHRRGRRRHRLPRRRRLLLHVRHRPERLRAAARRPRRHVELRRLGHVPDARGHRARRLAVRSGARRSRRRRSTSSSRS